MKKFVVLMLVLAVASLVSAAPVIKLGDSAGVFGAGNTNITSVAAGGLYDVYVWASNDRALVVDPQTEEVAMNSGLDNFQMFLRYNSSLVNLDGGLITKVSAVSGNPFGTVWSGRAQGTDGGLAFAEGALLPAANADVFALTKIAKITFNVATLGSTTTVTLTPNASLTHQSKVGNSSAGLDYFAASNPSQSVTFTAVPEPITMALLGLGGLFLRRKK